ncbi:quinohemoprotein amine dehydrogenase subunit alpha [Novosphingobium sp. NBM11]|uniref:quinohemoprotein amine dehydrogenase subunit alpha n=1 Tax=Novosphingobium sp. NBM11 TaxID=2596914 RepID=UPI002106EAB8|nr:quinohemoprotein amine dehydrogenase subunit alpha [Novosphingobium sp. NBM11]
MAYPDTESRPHDAQDAAASPSWRAALATRLSLRPLLLAGLCTATAVVAQAGGMTGGMAGGADKPESEEGIPVTDSLTKEKCGACHTADAKGNLSRISWLRTTPEGWAQAIKRMVKLNGLQITPEESRQVVRYLSSSHGLAPEEARPVMYLVEHRIQDETNIPSESLRGACATCHAFAQPLSWRRSGSEWKLLQDFHVALYSQADVQYRRPATDEPGAVFGQPTPIVSKPGATPVTQGQIALDYTRKVAPLHTPEWTQWKSRMQDPRLAGKWLVSASAPGKGRFIGTMTIGATADSDEFKTGIALRSLTDGSTLSRTGNGIVYAGYSWRGRSAPSAQPSAPDALDNPTRETMWFSPDRKNAEGRWFWGEYQEFGFDVKLVRADGSPTIGAVWPNAIKAGTRGVDVHIFGDSLPAAPTAKDIDLGAGLAVTRVVTASPTEIVVSVDAAPGAVAGVHDVSVGSAVLASALPVYRKVDYLKVTPDTNLSRLGGAHFAKGYAQFDAVGFDNGPDGKPNTADDVNIGPVAADWSIQEFQSVWYDDDKAYVGSISQKALFTPNVDGPNPQRSGNRNNYGEVWVVATAKAEKDAQGKPLTAKSYLVVTVPAYKRWDQPEVSQ